MNIANYLSYNKQSASVRVKSKAMSYPPCFGTLFTLIYIVLVQCVICLKFLSSFLVVLKVS